MLHCMPQLTASVICNSMMQSSNSGSKCVRQLLDGALAWQLQQAIFVIAL